MTDLLDRVVSLTLAGGSQDDVVVALRWLSKIC